MIELCKRCKDRNGIYLGQVIYLPKGNHVDYRKVIALRQKGKSINEIARAVGVTGRRVCQILVARRQKIVRVDYRKVIALWQKEKSANEIARALGITSRRVWQILLARRGKRVR